MMNRYGSIIMVKPNDGRFLEFEYGHPSKFYSFVIG